MQGPRATKIKPQSLRSREITDFQMVPKTVRIPPPSHDNPPVRNRQDSSFFAGHADGEGLKWIRFEQRTVENTNMLSEHHDISHEFPEYHRMIEALRLTDKSFDALVAKHDFIDDEIRLLEEKQSPISDEEIEKMKFQRASLKDQIYQILRASATKA